MDCILGYFQELGSGAGYLILLIASGLVFLLMTGLSFDGGGDADIGPSDLTPSAGGLADVSGDGEMDAGSEADDDGPGIFRYLSFRNCVNYLLGFGAGGYLATIAGVHPTIAAGCAISGGAVTAALMYKLMVALHGLSEEQVESGQDALGALARVYIEIGPNRSHRGKVLVTVKSAQRELFALTDHGAPLPPSTSVRIVAMEGDTLLVVPAAESTSVPDE